MGEKTGQKGDKKQGVYSIHAGCRALYGSRSRSHQKKASPCAMLFAFKRHTLFYLGLLGDFSPSHFIELVHVNYTVESYRQVKKSI